jgi:trigger factor
VQFLITFDEQDRGAAEHAAILRIGQTIRIDGFRPGKAPADALKTKINPDTLFEETVRELLHIHLHTLAEAEKVLPIIPPKVAVQSRSPVLVQVIFVERPEAKIKGSKHLAIPKKESAVAEKDVERVLRSILREHETRSPVECAAAAGDAVRIDFTGRDDRGNTISGATATGYEITLGEGRLVPGFEDALLGLKAKEQKTFTVTMPKKYHEASLQGKPVTFSVTVQEVFAVKLPELTDSFVQQHFKEPNIAALKEKIASSLKAQEEHVERLRREREFLRELEERTSVELADELLEEEERGLIQDLAEELKEQKQRLEDWLKTQNKTMEEFQKDLRKRASQRLTVRFGLAALIAEKQITVSEEEMNRVRTSRPKSSQDEIHWIATVEKLMGQILG